jgi:hypothetical protein
VIENLDLFTPEECIKINSIIHDLNNYWDRRNEIFPFFTLGVPAYLDADRFSLQSRYLPKVLKHNAVLSENLGWMYDRLADCLSNHLSAPVKFHPTYSLPGFHIYLYNDIFRRDDVAMAHFDMQFKNLVWEERVDFDNSLSITMAIALPKSGSGMLFWDLQYTEVDECNRRRVYEMKQSKTRNYFGYQPGKLVLHPGNFLHQVGLFQDPNREDERITLQGHMAFYHGSWHLYW